MFASPFKLQTAHKYFFFKIVVPTSKINDNLPHLLNWGGGLIQLLFEGFRLIDFNGMSTRLGLFYAK